MCRWQKVTSQKSAIRIQEVRWRRGTLLRFSILPSLRGNTVHHVKFLIILSPSICWFDLIQICLILLVVFRPEDRVNRLAEQLANSEGKIGENPEFDS